MLKDIVITEQPVCACVPRDFPLTLRCRAQGSSFLHYQWFLYSETFCKEIPGANQPDLHIVGQQTQLYVCRINDQHRHIAFSHWVKVKVLKDINKDYAPPGWEGDPVFIMNPVPVHLTSQQPVQFQCCAIGIPAPKYQWYLNGQCLQHRKGRKMQIKAVKPKDCGSYLCCATNAKGERWSEPVELTRGNSPAREKSIYLAAGKVALIIGNNCYLNHPNLLAPVVDVCELSILLSKLGFCVISLVDLARSEMLTAVNKFLQFLDKGVYGLFYYAGHGYERSGRNYMVPIDAPQPYRPENCISVQKILQKMQERRTALNVVLLDTCRKWYNADCALSKVNPLKPFGNTVYGYATCENAEAYEVQDGNSSSGIFMTYLKKYILEEKKVTHMLEDVLEDIGRDPLITGKQVMEIKHTLTESRALTDRICSPQSERLNRKIWDKDNEMPKQILLFPCGVKVEVSFQSVFSNLIHVFARLIQTPSYLTDIRTILYRSSDLAELSIPNSCRLGHEDSLLAMGSEGEEADCMLRLPGLQKCQNDIFIKLDLHCTDMGTGIRLQESLEHKIPKPCVTRLFSQKDTSLLDWDSAAGSSDSGSRQRLQSSTDSHKREPAAHTLGHAGGISLGAQSKSSSEPEENDESDLFAAL
ncbi:mucosa-associated lymphoid tissue lymphoma translocation protein 1 [Xenopus laevis]|uniref:Mucosa-associated Lymphoid Tissue lymphoma translocation protein 1 n=2 Tax=Xenopus laevis TaxID=8355 RepID=A0A1L8GTG8_XENLA|nr:mucosa-associated lymphoid tissue lymphoma translocation protein 1 [Xenopus laevis]XP_041444325.1 mucosa-associated lymphoid tissue lymphoma translocation protein 1 [Xenopus laevis]OCT87127.1 hypothetical protein XELAEV_18020821mg [Xenopus laevis]